MQTCFNINCSELPIFVDWFNFKLYLIETYNTLQQPLKDMSTKMKLDFVCLTNI